MTLVKVWNDNKHPFSQEFKGEKIHIKAGEFHEMDLGEAKEFLGLHSPIIPNADGGHDERYAKNLRIDVSKAVVKASPEIHKCQACGHVAVSAKELEQHIEDEHVDALADTELADKIREKQKGKTK